MLGPIFIGFNVACGGASRIPNGTDTDTAADWLVNDSDGFGFPGFPGSPSLGQTVNTPAAVNVAITVPTDPEGVCNDPATLIHEIRGNGLSGGDPATACEAKPLLGLFDTHNGQVKVK